MANYSVLMAERVNISEFRCGPDCSLYHSRMTSDWVEHFLVEFHDVLSSADVILLERQPPVGHRDVEQLLVAALRGKIQMVHPISVHSFLGMRGLNYDERKVAAVHRARQLFGSTTVGATSLRDGRVHDVADAMMMIHYYCCRVVRTWDAEKGSDSPIKATASLVAHFEQFRFHKRR